MPAAGKERTGSTAKLNECMKTVIELAAANAYRYQ